MRLHSSAPVSASAAAAAAPAASAATATHLELAQDRGPRKTIYELSAQSCAGDTGCHTAPASDLPSCELEGLFGAYCATTLPTLPRVTETELMRHYGHLASMNFGVDTGTYPLGSCTMKYNPRIHEDAVRLPGFAQLHPAQPAASAQGILGLMYELQNDLSALSGFAACSLQPAAGAHGEYAALMVFRAAHQARGRTRRTVIIPDTAHGTNPASVAMAGYEVVTVASSAEGLVDLEALRAVLTEDTAAFMLTNPNTLGLFDSHIQDIIAAVHAVGAYAYCDGANLNAILGLARPGDMGFDALHINLHKTFATPHGGGGPGAGPVCVSAELAPYLPGPIVAVAPADPRAPAAAPAATATVPSAAPTPTPAAESYCLTMPERSIGPVRSFYGNVAVLVRAWAYIRALGSQGLRTVAEQAVLSANYLRCCLQERFQVAYDRICMHEFVLSGAAFRERYGVRTLDIAKRLLDYGFHPPTVYFPLLVEEAMMIEPTETESLASLDALARALLAIADEAEENPDLLHAAPYTTPLRRLDETAAARTPDLRWTPSSTSVAET
jgi:glycine dehydrogenase subunit 2